MSKRILLITAEYPPCGGGGVGRPYAVSRALAERGHAVTVLTAAENMYWVRNESLDPNPPSIAIERVKAPDLKPWFIRLKKYLPKLAPADHFFLWQRLAYRKAKKMHKAKPFDLVISTYPFTSNHAVAYRLARGFKLAWIADYRDPPWWMYTSSRPMQPEFFSFAQYASMNVTTTQRAKHLLCEKLSLPENKVTVLLNGCDDYAATLEAENDMQSEGFTFLHTGSFYPEGRDVDGFIEAASRVSASLTLRFIGDPPYPSTQALLAQLPQHISVEFEDYKPSREVLGVAAKHNALVVIQGDLFENQIPGKIFECLALQKPVLLITNKGSATYDLVKDEPNVIWAEYDNIDSIQSALEKTLQHQVVAIDRFRYTRKNLVEGFAKLVDEIDT